MARKHLVKLNDEEIQALQKARAIVKRFGTDTLPESARKALKDDALGSYVHLGSLLIIKNYAQQNSFPSQRK